MVGVDGSVESRRAIELARRIAEAAHAELVPVHAVPDLWLAGRLDRTPLIIPEIREALIRDSRKAMERFLEGVLSPAARRRLEVWTGPAAVAITEVARTRRAELVVLGGRHHGAIARGLGRSTAHYLVRTLDVPLLVAGPSTPALARVLAAVDLSPASIPTIEAAERFANLLGARLRVVHVLEPLRLTYVPIEPLREEGFHERARQMFDRLTASLNSVAPEDRLIRTGAAADAIAEEAAAWHADLLVVGSHGKGWADRLLIGSTTERLLNALPASLLVIPTALPRRRAPRRARKPTGERRAAPRRRRYAES